MKKTKSQRQYTCTLSTFHSMNSIEQSPKFSSKACSITPDHRFEAIFKFQAILLKKIVNRKRYYFQMLKQFYLFSDSSMSSSCTSVSKYDPLLFSDQKLHTVFKILESQLIQRKIWGFINLRANKLAQDLKEMVTCAQNVIHRVQYSNKATSFNLIKHHKRASQANQTNISRNRGFERYQEINIAVNCPSKLATPEKSVKFDVNLSSRTAAESDHEEYYIRRRQDEGCSVCCCHSCCCCSCCSFVSYHKDDLWDRIQYMKRLEELIREREE